MNLVKKITLIFFLLIPISISFAEMVTFNQRVTVNEVGETDKGGTGSDDADWGIAAGIEFNPDGTKMFVSFSQNFDGTGEIDPLIINTYNLSILKLGFKYFFSIFIRMIIAKYWKNNRIICNIKINV